MKNNPGGILLNCLLFLLSHLIRKQKGTFLIGARSGETFSENSKYLYLYANKIKKNKNFVWFTRNRSLFNKLKEEKLPVVFASSFQGFYKILISEKLVVAACPREVSYFRYLFGNFKIIQLSHGNAIKSVDCLTPKSKTFADGIRKSLLKKQYSKYDFILHTSKKTKKIFTKSFANAKVKVLGYPRNDFRKKSFYKYENLNFIPLNKKIFLYAPTYRAKDYGKTPFHKKELYELDKFLKEKRYYLILKNHSYEKVFPNSTKFKNILDISEKKTDIAELLPKIDVLITDYSSVCFDFSLLKKPIIFYPYDYKKYELHEKIVIDYFNDLPGPFAYNEKELFALISNLSWSKKRTYLDKYEKFMKDFNDFTDGKSCERTYNEIIK